MSIIYLTLDDILEIHLEQINRYGGSHGIRDRALLESALMRPQMTFGGVDLYVSLFEKSAALMHSIILNHPFIDGNKRTGTDAALTFLAMNDVTVRMSNKQLVELAVSIAEKRVSLEQLEEWLEKSLDDNAELLDELERRGD